MSCIGVTGCPAVQTGVPLRSDIHDDVSCAAEDAHPLSSDRIFRPCAATDL